MILIRKFLFLLPLLFCSAPSDAQEIYEVNRWVSGGITAAGVAASIAAYPHNFWKPDISDSEFTAIDKNKISGIDSWGLEQPPAERDYYEIYSTGLQGLCNLFPLFLGYDERMKSERLDLFLMYLEVSAVTLTIYQVSPLGPLFQDKYRPIVYYDNYTRENRKTGYNRNSFYSGHTAAAAASIFFAAKVYTDYHPELGKNKYFFFGAAMIPPLLVGYFRLRELMHFPSDILIGFGIGALCGIGIPEIHRLVARNSIPTKISSAKVNGWSVGITYQGSGWNLFFR